MGRGRTGQAAEADLVTVRSLIAMIDLPEVDSIIERYEPAPASLIAVLQDVQERWQYLPREVLEHVAVQLAVPLSQAYRVATFYSAFSLQPRGRHLVSVCTGTACHVRGSGQLLERLRMLLAINPGQTTADRLFTLETVHCMGCCSLAPAIRIDETVFARVGVGAVEKLVKRYEKNS